MEPQGRGVVYLDVVFLSMDLASCMERGQKVKFSCASMFRADVVRHHPCTS